MGSGHDRLPSEALSERNGSGLRIVRDPDVSPSGLEMRRKQLFSIIGDVCEKRLFSSLTRALPGLKVENTRFG